MRPSGELASLSSTLESLRDVAGMAGSFVVSDLGRLLGRDMPAVFGDDVLGEIGPRALRLRDTLGHESDTMGSLVIQYTDYLLFVRPLRDGLLCALGTHEVNLPAVRMAMTLTVRRLNGILDGTGAPPLVESSAVSRTQEITLDGTGTGSGTSAPAKGPDDGSQAGKAAAPVRMYRGTVVGGG